MGIPYEPEASTIKDNIVVDTCINLYITSQTSERLEIH